MNEGEDILSKFAYKYKTDKCPRIKHPFTPYYYELLKDRRNFIGKVLEIGVGYSEMARRWRTYRTGASLLMWRDFFPCARIYGVDILPQAQYNGWRIKSFLCDQTSKEGLENIIKEIGSNIDLVIDDGSHFSDNQIFTCQTLMPLINKDVIYIIEDATNSKRVARALSEQYKCQIPDLKGKTRDDKLVVVTNKQ